MGRERDMGRQRAVYNPYIDSTAAQMLQSSLVVQNEHLLGKLMNGILHWEKSSSVGVELASELA